MDTFNEFLGLKLPAKRTAFLTPYTHDEDNDDSDGKSIEEISIFEEENQASDFASKEDDWVMEPGFVQSTKLDIGKCLDKLQSHKENVRLQGTDDLRVTLKYDEVFGLKILGDLFSIFAQASTEYLSTLEILKTILTISKKSSQVVRIEFFHHFYNTLYVLAKRGEIEHWTHKKHNGIYFSTLIKELFEIYKPEKEEEWEIAIPIFLLLSKLNVNLFRHLKLKFLGNPTKFKDQDVEKILDLFVEHEPKELSLVLKSFYQSHSKTLISYQDKIITKEESNLNFEYLFQLSFLNPNSILESLEKLKVTNEETLSSMIQLMYRTVHVSYQSCFHILEKIQNQIDSNVKIQNDPIEVIYIYGIIGRALENEKNSKIMVDNLLKLLEKSPRYFVYRILKALSNITQSKPDLLTEDVMSVISPFKDDFDYDIRRMALEFKKKSSSSEDLIELQTMIDLQNVKISEQNLEISKLQKKITTLEEKIEQ
eukprot:gene10744-3364_t